MLTKDIYIYIYIYKFEVDFLVLSFCFFFFLLQVLHLMLLSDSSMNVPGTDFKNCVNWSQTFLFRCFFGEPMLSVIQTILTMWCTSKFRTSTNKWPQFIKMKNKWSQLVKIYRIHGPNLSKFTIYMVPTGQNLQDTWSQLVKIYKIHGPKLSKLKKILCVNYFACFSENLSKFKLIKILWNQMEGWGSCLLHKY